MNHPVPLLVSGILGNSGLPKPTQLQKRAFLCLEKKHKNIDLNVNPCFFVDIHIPFLQDGFRHHFEGRDTLQTLNKNHFGFR